MTPRIYSNTAVQTSPISDVMAWIDAHPAALVLALAAVFVGLLWLRERRK